MVGMNEILIYNIIPLIFLIIIYFIWKKYGEDEKVNSITSKYPPNNLNILQVSYLYTDDINDEDFTPFMIQLAKEGYIKIIKDKKNYKIIKIKTPKEEIKSYFIKELFKNKEEIDIKNFKNRISKLMNVIKKKIESKYEVENVYESKSLSKKSLTKFMIFIIYIMSILKLLIDLKNIKLFLLCIIIPCIGISILFKNSKSKKLNIKIIGIIISVIFILLPIILLESKIDNFTYSFIYLINIILIDIMLILNALMPKKKTNIIKLKSKIKGFKNFISNNDNIIPLIKENIDYYYEIYPYSYIFKIDNIIKLKETLGIKNPSWYEEK